jgi:protein regulator of cytokinesis 1
LTEEKSRRQGELNDYLGRIKNLWDVLRVGAEARERFLGSRSGLSRELIHSVRVEMENLLEQKLARMKELNLTAQAQIESLWESLSVPETERRLHMEQYTGKFTEENYNALTALIATLEKKYAQAKPILEFIEQRQILLHEAEELRKAAADPRRLLDKKHSATNLLNEEKIRKRIERTLPKIEENLFKYLSQWESEHGEPLLWRGNDYLAIMEDEREEAERTQKEAKMRKEMERASRLGMGPSSMATPLRTPSKSERIIRPITPAKTPMNASKSLREMSSIGRTPAKTPSKQVVSAAPTTPKSFV